MYSKFRTRFDIRVTQDDIDRAHRNDSYHCVVAQAIARAIPEATNIDVDTQTIRFTLKGERLWYLTPYAVQGYVIAFDAGDHIEPFRFRIDSPRRARRDLRNLEVRREQKRAERVARAEREGRIYTPRSSVADTETPATLSTAVPPEVTEAGAVLAAYGAEVRSRGDGGVGKPPPRVFRTKRRSYGHRLLRINQARDAGDAR
jgi:hypothetical protein